MAISTRMEVIQDLKNEALFILEKGKQQFPNHQEIQKLEKWINDTFKDPVDTDDKRPDDVEKEVMDVENMEKEGMEKEGMEEYGQKGVEFNGKDSVVHNVEKGVITEATEFDGKEKVDNVEKGIEAEEMEIDGKEKLDNVEKCGGVEEIKDGSVGIIEGGRKEGKQIKGIEYIEAILDKEDEVETSGKKVFIQGNLYDESGRIDEEIPTQFFESRTFLNFFAPYDRIPMKATTPEHKDVFSTPNVPIHNIYMDSVPEEPPKEKTATVNTILRKLQLPKKMDHVNATTKPDVQKNVEKETRKVSEEKETKKDDVEINHGKVPMDIYAEKGQRKVCARNTLVIEEKRNVKPSIKILSPYVSRDVNIAWKPTINETRLSETIFAALNKTT